MYIAYMSSHVHALNAQEMIDTVRDTRIHSVKGATTTAEFMISRFKLQVIVQLTAPPGTHTVEFKLDPHCTAAGKRVLKEVRQSTKVRSFKLQLFYYNSYCTVNATYCANSCSAVAATAVIVAVTVVVLSSVCQYVNCWYSQASSWHVVLLLVNQFAIHIAIT
jgi:hypothetical protein